MREILKTLWIWGGNAMTATMSLFAVLFFSSRKVARKLNKLSNEADKTRKAFVLGNGPSLNDVLSKSILRQELEQGDVIVTNRFAISADFTHIKPHYYILMDPLFFDEASVKNDPSMQEMYEAFNRVTWPMILFLPKEANLKIVSNYLHNLKVNVVLYNGTTVVGPVKFQNYMYRHGMGLPNSRNIILPALMLMINIGYKNIYLYGAEFSWTKNFDVNPKNNRVFLNDRHFYKTDDVLYDDPSYTYDKGYYRWSLESIAEMLRGTEMIATYAESQGTNVINRTKGSFIDAFEYENPDNIS